MKKTDYIIIGQGLAGSLLAYDLIKSGKNILIIDEEKKSTSSKIAAGIVLPITGRRIVKSWKADVLIPFAQKFYSEIENELGEKIFFELPLVELFNSIKNRNDWLSRSADEEFRDYIKKEADVHQLNKTFNASLGGIIINNSGFLLVNKLIDLFKEYFQREKIFKTEVFSFADLKVYNDKVEWKNYLASKIIFCEGYSAILNPFFKAIPFLPAKGEILKIYSEEIPEDKIINHGMYILPMGNHEFKVGATYEWNFKDELPSAEGRKKIETFLKKILKINFSITDHEAAIRPTVQDRRPLIGINPSNAAIGIFNGLGTKGVMLAPYFAKQFSEFLIGNGSIESEVNVGKYF